MNPLVKKLTLTGFVCAALFLGIAFFVWTIFPYAQMSVFMANFKAYPGGDTGPLFTDSFEFYPETFLQAQMRYEVVQALIPQYTNGSISNNQTPLVVFMTQKLAESVSLGNKDHSEQYLDLGRAYDILASVYPDKAQEYHSQAGDAYRQALALFPGEQSILYAYIINLSHQNKIDDSLRVAEQALAEDPRVPESHYYLGIALFTKDNNLNAVAALSELEFALDNNANPIPEFTLAVYEKMLQIFYTSGDSVHLITVLNRLIQLNPNETATYQKILTYMKTYNQIPLLNLTPSAN